MDYQPNKIAYVTGASSGIGEALVSKLLEEGYYVIGLSRSAISLERNFEHHAIDLSNIDAVQKFEFKHSAPHVLLVNNAGCIGDIKPIGKNTNSGLLAVSNLNALAPQLLINTFLNTYLNKVEEGHILNISSGAGKYPIDSWAPYCASKASLDLFSKTVQEELNTRSYTNWFVHAIAPGVVDTPMQNEIRSSDPNEFKVLQKFIDLKKNGELSDPNSVAQKLYRVIESPQDFHNVVISVRDFS